MKRRCGVKQGLRKCWFHLHNEIQTRWGGLQKRDRFWCASHLWMYCQRLENETNHGGKVPKPEKRDFFTRWGDSVNLLYWGHKTNKSPSLNISCLLCSQLLFVSWCVCFFSSMDSWRGFVCISLGDGVGHRWSNDFFLFVLIKLGVTGVVMKFSNIPLVSTSQNRQFCP